MMSVQTANIVLIAIMLFVIGLCCITIIGMYILIQDKMTSKHIEEKPNELSDIETLYTSDLPTDVK